MVAKRKVFKQTDLTVPAVEYEVVNGRVTIPEEVVPPEIAFVSFPNGSKKRHFYFDCWYGVGIDAIVYACQRQIERFLAKQDSDVEVATVITYCDSGLNFFLEYLAVYSAAVGRDLTLGDINRDVIDGYVVFLTTETASPTTRKNRYTSTKSVLTAMCDRGLIVRVRGGDEATFPRNPFPRSHLGERGEKPLALSERKAFATAVKAAVMPIFDDRVEPTSETLAYAYLIIALHTGGNVTPLLEMSTDCLRPHPKADTAFLVLFKRRGQSTKGVVVNDGEGEHRVIESLPTLRPTVAKLVRRVIELSSRLRDDAPDHYRSRVWLFRVRRTTQHTRAGDVTALTPSTLALAIKTLVNQYGLKDADGRPLRLNVSRLRKTFVNRVFDLLGGDVTATAAAAGNSVDVTSISYLRPGEDARSNWRFLGIALTNELLTNTLGATEKTPVGRCSDVRQGQFAPKKPGAVCMSFLNCVRCKNYVVTGEDLYRLFSFYWRVLAERAHMNARRWRKSFAHIVRVIDRDIIDVGLAKGIFKAVDVKQAREHARVNPHPFWRTEDVISTIHEMSS
ncbi:hypothetical protein SCB29_23010 [Paraburkholderia sp. SIMBA_055]|uniref:hypothetical protein n=1 Tax=unclassified Paraburkholderia TaxID=2615204 RepID=UPI000D308EBB|nr:MULTISPECIES: hypothetical protein [unclassified Paraburkholderia]PTQ96483.1 hypothetical protein C8K19_110234 [Paraburkholderia sp. GV072]PUB00781.1 hypothetical protein C8K18_11442 [Paraburkholderia sp. GV068]